MSEYDALDWPKRNEGVKTYYVHYVVALEGENTRLRGLLERAQVQLKIHAPRQIGLVEEIEKELADEKD